MTEFKYLAVRNWAKYQGKVGKIPDVRRPYIKTASTLDSDPDFSQLRVFPRYILEGCRRLIAVHGQNLRNDPMWVSRALCLRTEERRFAYGAITVLVRSGFLLLTNQSDPFSNDTKEYEINDNETISPSASEQTEEQTIEINPGEEL